MLHHLLALKTDKVCVHFVGTKFGTYLMGKKDEFFNDIVFIIPLELFVCIGQDIFGIHQHNHILSKKYWTIRITSTHNTIHRQL